MNKVILIGRLTSDPELKHMPQINVPVLNSTIAIDRYNKLTGEKQTDFIRIVIKGKQAEQTAKKMRKGGEIAIEGMIHTRSYETEDKQRRFVVEVIATFVEHISNVIIIEKGNNNNYNYNENVDFYGTPFESESVT